MRGDATRLLRNLALLIGLAGVLALGAVALFGPQLAAVDPHVQRVVIFYPGGDFKAPPTAPDEFYPLGTDPLGRDQVARILWGARTTFTVVLLALLVRSTLAISLGVLAGWRRGAADNAVVWLTNAVSGVPQLLLAVLVAVALREHAVTGFVVALGAVGWAEAAQYIRGEVVRVRAAPYVEAAAALGTRTRGIIGRHVLRNLAPQLIGLLALEAGAALLLLAELGFIGVFISGGAFYIDDNGRPILPIRDRAPEWGQMLAGARQYAFNNQYVAFVPGVVVAAAVFAFNLLGEGVRAASDPFSSLSLSPRALGALGRGLAALTLVSATAFGAIAVRSTEISLEAGMRLAREAAARVAPEDQLIAAVVRFSADAHGMAKPAKMNFYFRATGERTILRVGFENADQNTMDVKPFDDEDGLAYEQLQPLGEHAVAWTEALQVGEDNGGRVFRNSGRTWQVRVILSQEPEFDFPTYHVWYSPPIGPPIVDVLLDARTGASEFDPTVRLAQAGNRARTALGGPVELVSASASWSSSSASPTAYGTDRPANVGLSFTRSDLVGDLRVATVFFGAAGIQTQTRSGELQRRPPAIVGDVDLARPSRPSKRREAARCASSGRETVSAPGRRSRTPARSSSLCPCSRPPPTMSRSR